VLVVLVGVAAGDAGLYDIVADDECAAEPDSGDGQCSLHALQFRGIRHGPNQWEATSDEEMVGPVELRDSSEPDADEKNEAVEKAMPDTGVPNEEEPGRDQGTDQAGNESVTSAEITDLVEGVNVAELGAEHQAEITDLVEGVNVTELGAGYGIWHYARNCWHDCGRKGGWCESYCGPGNACCRHGAGPKDPLECRSVEFFPVTTFHTCVRSSHTRLRINGRQAFFQDRRLYRRSRAPWHEFYMYRAQSDENYPPENQNLGNLAGIMWYLHNEIVWHHSLARGGTYFSTPKTRIERFKVKTRATQPLYEMGMNFGVLNEFDSGQCTGPYNCNNFAEFGYAVGCETWHGSKGAAFPHYMWKSQNHYPGATWYSLPGPCSSRSIKNKTAECQKVEIGGAGCPLWRNTPSGTGSCTYSYVKVGEITLNELEGITDPQAFIKKGGHEYIRSLDKGTHMTFWDNMHSEKACEKRVAWAHELFRRKYPYHTYLAEPACDFDHFKFYKST